MLAGAAECRFHHRQAALVELGRTDGTLVAPDFVFKRFQTYAVLRAPRQFFVVLALLVKLLAQTCYTTFDFGNLSQPFTHGGLQAMDLVDEQPLQTLQMRCALCGTALQLQGLGLRVGWLCAGEPGVQQGHRQTRQLHECFDEWHGALRSLGKRSVFDAPLPALERRGGA
ncbi:hypothetical protein A6E19_12840 [Pseudomonas putida]|nr:hypothetical protein A6E23_15680 [Pseudomonas putida]OCT27432.1 hypothetical protein A6E20_08640 [Pseudomonas putida]OCT28715.1 hypothetical protein A6E24_08455 [Pseudomonas putida]OCT38052.1 hypothetical protein A6E19_12840 [Pseudomonas putida]